VTPIDAESSRAPARPTAVSAVTCGTVDQAASRMAVGPSRAFDNSGTVDGRDADPTIAVAADDSRHA